MEAVGRRVQLKTYVDTCAALTRCQEEEQILLREARDAVEFFDRCTGSLDAALFAVTGAEPNSEAHGRAMLLQYELDRVRLLHRRAVTTYSKLQVQFGVTASVDPHQDEDDAVEVVGADPEEIPEYEDAPDDDGSSDSGYTSDGQGSDEELIDPHVRYFPGK